MSLIGSWICQEKYHFQLKFNQKRIFSEYTLRSLSLKKIFLKEIGRRLLRIMEAISTSNLRNIVQKGEMGIGIFLTWDRF